MGKTGRRCLVVGCERAAEVGRGVCGRHVGSREGAEVERGVARLTKEAERAVATGSEEREAARRRFQRRLTRGDYGGLFDRGVVRVMEAAAQERDLAQEVGALRLAMARLLMEEDDPNKLALGVSRLANALARTARTRAAIGVEAPDDLLGSLSEVLAELDAERAARMGGDGEWE